MNKALFFPIFVNDFDEVQLTTLKRKYGIKGYGIYTFLRTKLQDVDNYEYPIKLIPDLAYLSGVQETEMLDIIYNSGLFIVGNDYFSCPLLDEVLQRHNGIIAKKSAQGKKGGVTRMSTLTPEQRKKLAKEAADKRWGNDTSSNTSSNTLSDASTYASTKPENTDSMPANNLTLASNAGIMPSNEIDIEIEIEKEIEKEKEIESEIENDIESKNLNSFSSFEIENEIKNYTPIYFSINNYQFLTDYYIKYKVEVNNIIMTLPKFEKLLFFIVVDKINIEITDDTIIPNNTYINKYIQDNSIILNVNDFKIYLNNINTNADIKMLYGAVISQMKIIN